MPPIYYVRLEMRSREDNVKRYEFYKRRRSTNIALGVILLVLVVLFYLITFVKFGGGS